MPVTLEATGPPSRVTVSIILHFFSPHPRPPPAHHSLTCENMFATFLTLALLAAPALRGVAADDFTVNTPSATQCGNVKLTWGGTAKTYNVVIVNATDPCGDILADIGDVQGNAVNWTVKFEAGSRLMVSVADADNEDDEGWSGAILVGKSSDSSCLDNAAAAPSSALSGIGSVSTPAASPTVTVEAAGADPTAGSPDPDSDGTTPDGALGATSGASALHMNPFMALCAAFAVALAL